MHETNFGGCDLWFQRSCPFFFPSNLAKLTFQTGSYYSPWGQLKKFMQVEIDGKCMQTNF